jgi:autotransporter-associated beta strand protein
VKVGSIEGTGTVFLGARNLTVGSNNLDTSLSGGIMDGGAAGGTGGSLSKIGTGAFSLRNSNTYTGGTIVNKGTLIVRNAIGSGTGPGPVQVNAGTLAGTGIISGAVTIGTGSGAGAFLSPGNIATKPGALTIQNMVVLNADSTYKAALNRATPTATKLTAMGVTINGAQFAFADFNSGTLTPGTVFTVINNTSANPIAGTFANLPDGATFNSNGTTFKANYAGGDGNALTLTVQ